MPDRWLIGAQIIHWDIGTVYDSLREFDIDYLVLYTASLTANDISDNMECIYQNDEYTIMKYKKSVTIQNLDKFVLFYFV